MVHQFAKIAKYLMREKGAGKLKQKRDDEITFFFLNNKRKQKTFRKDEVMECCRRGPLSCDVHQLAAFATVHTHTRTHVR